MNPSATAAHIAREPREGGQLAEALDRHAGKARAAHEASVEHGRLSVRHGRRELALAIVSGEELSAAKNLLDHGQWLPWVDGNFPGGRTTAQNYMRLAANAQRITHCCSVREALAFLRKPRPRSAVPRDALLKYLRVLAPLVTRRSAMLVLKGIRISAEESGRLTLRAVNSDLNLDLAIVVALEADVAPGEALVSAESLVEAVGALPSGPVSLTPVDSGLALAAGSARFHLRGMPLDEFPPKPRPAAEGRRVTVPARPFVEAIGSVARAASTDDTRPHLIGVLVTVSGSDLRMVATDSYRVAVKSTRLDAPPDGGFEIDVPTRALRLLAHLAADADEISVVLYDHEAVFEVGEARLWTRLVEGRFPDFSRLLPETFEHELLVPRTALLDVVTRVGSLSQKNDHLRLAFADGRLAVSVVTERAEAIDSLPVPFDAERFEIGFQFEFLRDGIVSAKSEDVLMKLIDPLRLMVIEAVGADDFTYLVMPVRLDVDDG